MTLKFGRWVGSLVPPQWREGVEYCGGDMQVSSGDLVLVSRSDGSLRFGEILSMDAAGVCQVCLPSCLATTPQAMSVKLRKP